MVQYLQKLSAFFFYILGLSFFACAVFLRSGIGGALPAQWMQVADLPLALSAVTFAGTSLILSVRTNGRSGRTLIIVTSVFLGLLFLALATLNFWPLFAKAGLPGT